MTNIYSVWLDWEDWPGSPDSAKHACNTLILRHLLGFEGFVGPADLDIEMLVQVLRQQIQQGSWEQINPLGLAYLNNFL